MAINTTNAGVIVERETAFLCLNRTGGSHFAALCVPLCLLLAPSKLPIIFVQYGPSDILPFIHFFIFFTSGFICYLFYIILLPLWTVWQ